MSELLKRYFIEFCYKGTAYHGWQIQQNATSVQSVMQLALSRILKESIRLTGAGRTDTGVHAKQMFAHFDCHEVLDDQMLARLVKSLNSMLPYDISVFKVIPVHENAHARFDATQRTYEYFTHLNKDPFLKDLSWKLWSMPDVEKMNKAAKFLLGRHDFSCFSKSHTQVYTHICEVRSASWRFQGNQLVFEISANRFLRDMVRAIVGTLLEVGNKGKPVEFIQEVMDSKNRSLAGQSVPAHGLFLKNIQYPYL